MSADFKHYKNRMRELKERFGLDGLQVEGMSEAPKEQTLKDASNDFDQAMFKGRGLKTSYGHAYVKTGMGEDDFKPVRIWFDWKP